MWHIYALMSFAAYGFGVFCCNIASLIQPLLKWLLTAALAALLVLALYQYNLEEYDFEGVASSMKDIYREKMHPAVLTFCDSFHYCPASILRLSEGGDAEP